MVREDVTFGFLIDNCINNYKDFFDENFDVHYAVYKVA